MIPESRLVLGRILPAIFLISFATIGWQLALMRCLLISRYHHFSFLVISCALLGFGAGGTVLGLYRQWFQERASGVFVWGTLSLAASLPLCFRVGELLPLNVYFPPMAVTSAVSWWFVFWIVHGIPFLLAGVLIGLALMTAGERGHRMYAWNLAGSAAGALGGMILMWYVPANELVVPFSLSVLLGGVFLVSSAGSPKLYGAALCVSGVALAMAALFPSHEVFPLHVDQYKTLAYVERLVKQGSAERKASYYGPRGRVDLYSSPSFHTVMSLAATEPPPPMDQILIDGFQAGSIPSISEAGQAKFLLSTLAALPYRLIHPHRVLILGEAGGTFIWLARMSDAQSIVFVQPDENVIRILKNHPSRVLDDPRVRVVEGDPRVFLDRTEMKFDVIHLAGLEGFSAGSGGIGGLREDFLATVQGFRSVFDRLAPQGIASVVRGVQEPERDNIKIAATWIEALEQESGNPGDHLLVARDELSLATLVSKSFVTPDIIGRFLQACRDKSWDIEWFPGVQPEQTNRVHILPGPPGASISWYQHAVRALFSFERQEFYRNWIANVRPATDDTPFFYDFFKWRSISRLREVFGPLWPARAEMGFLVLMLAAAWSLITASVLLPGPIMRLRREREAPDAKTLALSVLYFTALGSGFMLLEMCFIQMFARFLGDPVVAAAVVVGSFLFFAGIGSINQPRVTTAIPGGILTAVASVAVLVLIFSSVFPFLFKAAAHLPFAWKVVAGVCMVAPLAFFMGMPFPWGLSVLYTRAAKAIPIAWAANGFASVVSASGAVVLAMTFGFKMLLSLAAVLYGLAGLVSLYLDRESDKLRKPSSFRNGPAGIP